MHTRSMPALQHAGLPTKFWLSVHPVTNAIPFSQIALVLQLRSNSILPSIHREAESADCCSDDIIMTCGTSRTMVHVQLQIYML